MADDESQGLDSLESWPGPAGPGRAPLLCGKLSSEDLRPRILPLTSEPQQSGSSVQEAGCPVAAARPGGGEASEPRRRTRRKDAEAALTLFYTEVGNSVGTLGDAQMCGQPPPRPGGRGPLQLSWDVGSMPPLPSARSPSPGQGSRKVLALASK